MGGKHASPPQNCNACGGSGEVKIGNNGSSTTANCSVCHGKGTV